MKLSTQSTRTLAWLGLFAMLMIFIAPSISSQLTENNQNKNTSNVTASLSEHNVMPHHPPENAAMMMHHDAQITDKSALDFCGYCSLFHHSPPLHIAIFILPGTETRSPQPLIYPLFGIIAFAPLPPYQTRAPPFHFLLS
ncbi:DUF2946 domain-containing protein [Serratia sp. NPDC078593]|uniref:DUF2946 domain-containing protein n=1 Tax=unclassified Serratia (in: enterobacteria) TaxID=2647522 RepID=UPI0037D3BDD8